MHNIQALLSRNTYFLIFLRSLLIAYFEFSFWRAPQGSIKSRNK